MNVFQKKSIKKYFENNISLQSRIYILSAFVGIASGLAAVILKNTVHFVNLWVTNIFLAEQINWLYLIYPIIGIIITVLFVKYIIKDNISHGISRVLNAISQENGILKKHNMFSSIIAGAFTVGMGGSVGLEAPVVLTGSSLGSNLGRWLNLDKKQLTLLIGCGAAGAVSGIFKAPIAGVIFTLEVLMLDLTMTSLIPLLIASVTASVLSSSLMGSGVLFSFDVTEHFVLKNIPFYILLGVFCGGISIYFSKVNEKIENAFNKIKKTIYKIIVGGLILSVLIFLFPPLYGEGYESLLQLLNGYSDTLLNGSAFFVIKDYSFLYLLFLLFVIVFKVVAMSATNAAGGVGGVFAPSLFTGGICGVFIARFVNILGFHHLPEKNFILAGMAGVMAGVMHAPLTSIFLIAEITGGYEFFIPLIITATISYIIMKRYEPHSLYTRQLAREGKLITHDKDKSAIQQLKVDNLIETNFNTINQEANLGEFVKVVSKSKRNLFPVIDQDNTFYGLIYINDVWNIIFDRSLYDNTYIKDLMINPDVFVNKGESMESVVAKFNDTTNYNLPVVENNKYIGFVSRANVFSAYRKLIKEYSDE